MTYHDYSYIIHILVYRVSELITVLLLNDRDYRIDIQQFNKPFQLRPFITFNWL